MFRLAERCEVSVAPGGSTSVSVTCAASSGPLLVTTTSKVTAPGAGLEAVCATARSLVGPVALVIGIVTTLSAGLVSPRPVTEATMYVPGCGGCATVAQKPTISDPPGGMT